ncbi:glycine oxidase ThiO [Simiduia curdlanivorans]|uniref:D-amino-acid oxidase n=1 Tax=Simiduia curdlanivorans TaxID=1492769 RepID=A0ABV8V4L4_9GAMM|nr:glycine oxidase ThiO [Simiduia curdlanivorans]MDN3639271.1 glycine oxidase ThiO [Simiduia curdlanivorans]
MTHFQNAQPHIAICGAGLLGRLLAWRLLLEGYKVYLFEASSFTASRAAAFTAAGMISPLSELAVSEKCIYDLGLTSLALWQSWLPALNTKQSLLSCNGSVALAHPQDHLELTQFYRDISHKLQGETVTAQWLDATQLRALEPQLNQFNQAIYLPSEAHVDNRQLLPLLLTSIKKLGGMCAENCPISFTDGAICEASTLNLKQLNIADNVDYWIDCRGMGAKLATGPLRGVRGEVLWVETKEVSFQRPIRLMHPRYKLYAVPKPKHQFIIGATEIESEDTSPISLQSTLELSSALYTLHPAFAEARVIETDTNLRPAYPNNQPQITQTNQVMSINGLYRHGFLLAPALVAEAIQQLKARFTPPSKPYHHKDKNALCKS